MIKCDIILLHTLRNSIVMADFQRALTLDTAHGFCICKSLDGGHSRSWGRFDTLLDRPIEQDFDGKSDC